MPEQCGDGMTQSVHSPSLFGKWQAELGEPIVALATTPDGGVIVGGSEGAICALGPSGRRLWQGTLDDALLALSVSTNGSRVLGLGMSSRTMWHRNGSHIATTACGWSAAASWDQQGKSVAVGDGRRVRLLGPDGEIMWSSPALPSTVTDVRWPRGRLRVAAAAYQGVTIFEPSSNRATNRLAAPGAISGIAVSPNGRWLVGGSQDATLHGWRVDDGTDFRMSGFPATVSGLAFESSGRWLACYSGDVVTCWDFSGEGPTGRSAAVLEGHRSDVTALAWTPGNRQFLVTGDSAGTVLTWNLRAGVRPGSQVRPISGMRDPDRVTAISTGGSPVSPAIFVGRDSGRLDAVREAR